MVFASISLVSPYTFIFTIETIGATTANISTTVLGFIVFISAVFGAALTLAFWWSGDLEKWFKEVKK